MDFFLPEYDAAAGAGCRLGALIAGQAPLEALAVRLAEGGAEVCPGVGSLLAMAPADADADRFLAMVAAAVDQDPSGAVIAETRWLPARLDQTETIRLGRRFAVVTGRESGGLDEIELAASGVFGSGLHASTRLAAQAIEELAAKAAIFPPRVLDVGTGSGILAILSGRWGAEEVLGIDIAQAAVAAARENVRRNGLSGRVRIEATPLPAVSGRFSLILANLTVSVLLRLGKELIDRLEPGGGLIVSGLQGRQQEEMAAFFGNDGLSVAARYGEGQWRALRLVKVNRDR